MTESYYKNKDIFIKKYGIDKWKTHCSIKDSMSIEHHMKKYGESYESHYHDRVNNVTRQFKFKMDNEYASYILNSVLNINNKEEWVDSLKNRFRNHGLMSRKYFVDLAYKNISANVGFRKTNFLAYGIILYSVTPDEIYDMLEIPKNDCIKERNVYSYNISCDGFYFRSDYEFTFYSSVKYFVDIIDVNKRYPNSKSLYDFKIEYKSEIYYIEICGYSKDDDHEYYERQMMKKDTYSSILVYGLNIFKFIEDIKNGKDIKNNVYY